MLNQFFFGIDISYKLKVAKTGLLISKICFIVLIYIYVYNSISIVFFTLNRFCANRTEWHRIWNCFNSHKIMFVGSTFQ